MVRGLDALRYASANARVMGLSAEFLSEEQWDELLSADSLKAAMDMLRPTGYGPAIAVSEESEGMALQHTERRLLGSAADDCRHAMTFLRGMPRQLLIVWWQHFELENLKAVFRGLEQNMAPDRIREFMIPLGDYSTLPWEMLMNEHSVTGLIERLDGTHYINPLRNAFAAYQREQSVFPLEVALDIRYYRDIAAVIKRLDREENSEARRILGTYIDILNVLWAYRYRVYYGLSAEEILNFTLWHTLHTDVDLVRDIALGAPPAQVVTRIWGQAVVDVSAFEHYPNEMEMLPRLELELLRYWRRLAQQARRGYPFRLGVLLGFVILRELEIQDLVTLLEGKKMGWSSQRIKEHLIRPKE